MKLNIFPNKNDTPPLTFKPGTFLSSLLVLSTIIISILSKKTQIPNPDSGDLKLTPISIDKVDIDFDIDDISEEIRFINCYAENGVTCIIKNENFAFEYQMIITNNTTKHSPPPSIISLENLLMSRDSQVGIPIVKFIVPGSSIVIKDCTLKNVRLVIVCEKLTIQDSVIFLDSALIQSNSKIQIIDSELTLLSNKCKYIQMEFFSKLFFKDLYENDLLLNEEQKCDFNPYEVSKSWFDTEFSNIDELDGSEVSNLLKSSLWVHTKNIIFVNSKVMSNAVIVANEVQITNKSKIMSDGSGNSPKIGQGIPTIYISHSFECGLNAGSYGGRGGIGISLKGMSSRNGAIESLNCIKNSISKMSQYGSPNKPFHSGSQGNSANTQIDEGPSPGFMGIFAWSIELDSSSMISSKSNIVNNLKGSQNHAKSSGGSIYLMAGRLNLKGNITVKGASSDNLMHGEGSGGRISIQNLCWFEHHSNHSDYDQFYSINKEGIDVSAGDRPQWTQSYIKDDIIRQELIDNESIDNDSPNQKDNTDRSEDQIKPDLKNNDKSKSEISLQKLQQIIQNIAFAKDGSKLLFLLETYLFNLFSLFYLEESLLSKINFSNFYPALCHSPCTSGRSGPNCEICSKGFFKFDILTKDCRPCLLWDKAEEYIVFEHPNNCHDYTCNPDTVKIYQSLNPWCYNTSNFFLSILNRIYHYIILILLILQVYLIIITVIRESKSVGKFYEEILEREQFSSEDSKSKVRMKMWAITIQGNNTPKYRWCLNMDRQGELRKIFNGVEYSSIMRVSPPISNLN